MQRHLVLPPTDLSAQLKESIEQTARHKSVPLYILTSQLDSDDDQLVVDPQDALEDEEDTSESSSSEEAPLPMSDHHVKAIAVLKTRLSQLETEMQELEMQGRAKERALRQLEEDTEQSEEHCMTQIPSTSEPDLSGTTNRSSKRSLNSRWRWTRSKRSVHRQNSSVVASHPPVLEQEMAESSKRERLFAELLAVISQRSKLVTQEAVIMAELKKIELEAYEETLHQAYDSLRQRDGGAFGDQSKVGALQRHRVSRFKKERIFPTSCEPVQEDRKKVLLNEMRKVSKAKNALTAVQGETMER
ncbi:unnamed protein product [Hydatigera taeniaeformis]|uniref:Shootin-1 n=1 Tax=Hydatigena taeniaeformis TaxID=6205 RepID=A0A0R3WYW2_HYDTA|nr:unnamed protein product [Hydatigera taeniaeformis]